jgi:hypothetical protein
LVDEDKYYRLYKLNRDKRRTYHNTRLIDQSCGVEGASWRNVHAPFVISCCGVTYKVLGDVDGIPGKRKASQDLVVFASTFLEFVTLFF